MEGDEKLIVSKNNHTKIVEKKFTKDNGEFEYTAS